jgi:hypothetical protein
MGNCEVKHYFTEEAHSAPAPAAGPRTPTVEEQIQATITSVLAASNDHKKKISESLDSHVPKLLQALRRPNVTSAQLSEIYANIEHPKQVLGRFVIWLWLEGRINKLPMAYLHALGDCVPGKYSATALIVLLRWSFV